MSMKYFCDRCGKEIKDSSTLFSHKVYRLFTYSTERVGVEQHLCEECEDELVEFFYPNR